MSAHFNQMASDGPTDATEAENDIIRHNWERIGYKYWFTDYGTEYWKHLETGHISNVIT